MKRYRIQGKYQYWENDQLKEEGLYRMVSMGYGNTGIMKGNSVPKEYSEQSKTGVWLSL